MLALAVAASAAVVVMVPTAAPAAEVHVIGASNNWPTSVIAGASTPDGDGFWFARANGVVEARGAAVHRGDAADIPLAAPIVGMAATPSGRGYWLVAADGGIFSFGDARFFGSMGGTALNQPVFSMTPTATGRGYWLVARDGGIFSFGDARFFGSMGGTPLNAPIGGITRSAGGSGYRMVATDGGIFSFGDADFYGSLGGTGTGNVVGMAPTPSGEGYWILTADGVIHEFGDALSSDSASISSTDPAVAIFANPRAQGFNVVTRSGQVLGFGAAPGFDEDTSPTPTPGSGTLSVPSQYAIRISGEGAFVNLVGGFDRTGIPFVVDGDLVLVPTLDRSGISGNGVNVVDLGIRTDVSPIVGSAGALWFGTNTSVSAAIGTSPSVGASNVDVSIVEFDDATRTITAQLDGDAFGLPTARINYLNVFNLRISVLAQIYNAFAGTVTVTLSPDGSTVNGTIEIGGNSGFAGPGVTTAYFATFTGVRVG
ncbi:MAG: hypothetical protein AAGA99_22215 [Actinomycetota bacterium]